LEIKVLNIIDARCNREVQTAEISPIHVRGLSYYCLLPVSG